MPSLGQFASAVRKRIYDNFAGRANTTGGLGTATDGSLWKAIRGTFTVTTAKATSGTDSNYPLATQSFTATDASIELTDIAQGASAAIWVVDSANWWAVGIDQITNTGYNCATCYNYFASTGGNPYYNYVAGTYVGSTCAQYQNSNGACPI